MRTVGRTNSYRSVVLDRYRCPFSGFGAGCGPDGVALFPTVRVRPQRPPDSLVTGRNRRFSPGGRREGNPFVENPWHHCGRGQVLRADAAFSLSGRIPATPPSVLLLVLFVDLCIVEQRTFDGGAHCLVRVTSQNWPQVFQGDPTIRCTVRVKLLALGILSRQGHQRLFCRGLGDIHTQMHTFSPPRF